MRNKRLFQRAQKHIPSGVNSPVRAFRAVGGDPLFIRRGKGPFLWDENGRRYLDFCASWGPLIFGHAPDGLLNRLARDMRRGTSFGAPTAGEVELAHRLHAFFPSIEKSRLVSSGTEAVMSTIRLARGFTGRKKIVKIDGGYHGHVDSLLVKAGSGAATFGTPDSAGVPAELAALTLTLPFNDILALEKIFRREHKSIAALILEPVPANMGVVPPAPDYLKHVSQLCDDYGILLVFDEVITGFRLAKGGAQEVCGVTPDLTCLGKIIGGGLPLAIFGGRADIMDHLAPAGPVYQAGTLSGNPLAVSAALWVLDQLEKKGVHQKLNAQAERFFSGIKNVLSTYGLPAVLNTAGSMFTLFFTPDPVIDYASAKKSDTQRYARFFHHCAGQGLYLAPSQFEANFISTVHTDVLLNKALKVIVEALQQ